MNWDIKRIKIGKEWVSLESRVCDFCGVEGPTVFFGDPGDPHMGVFACAACIAIAAEALSSYTVDAPTTEN